MTKVTYVPQDRADPSTSIWNEIKFPANVPVELDPKNRLHGYPVPTRKTIVDPATGREMFEYKETWVSMIELAKTNPSFQVEGEAPAAIRKPGRPRVPRTSEDYRSHAQAWIAAADNHEELEERWTEEEALRERCEVGDDDLSYLRPFFEAKHHELKKQAA
jgi:hypothetical protein